jgi:4-hydroxymandelate oxidase
MNLASLPPDLASLADHQRLAAVRLDPAASAYLADVAGDGTTHEANLRAWRGLRLWPRVLAPLEGSSPATTLAGRRLAHPILLAPVANQKLFHPDGELASAVAASAQQAGFVLSTLSNVPLEAVAAAVRGDADRGPLWFQLSMPGDRGQAHELVQRAEAAGYEALVLTVDAPVRRAGFRLPAGVFAANLAPGANQPQDLASLRERAPTWADVEWLCGCTRLPVVLKGVLHPLDARQAVTVGVQMLVVSNHGGRTLDGAPATAHALPRIRDALGGAMPLLVDGGIRRGTDVLKAVALGASAVLLGRPLGWGLANGGALGVAHVIRLLRDELEAAMALCGVTSLEALPEDFAQIANGLLANAIDSHLY